MGTQTETGWLPLNVNGNGQNFQEENGGDLQSDLKQAIPLATGISKKAGISAERGLRSKDINNKKEETLYSAFLDAARLYPGKTFLRENSSAISYWDAANAITGIAGIFSAKYGIRRGDIAAACMENGINFVLSALALNKLGAVFMPLNPDAVIYHATTLREIGFKLIIAEKPLHESLGGRFCRINPAIIAGKAHQSMEAHNLNQYDAADPAAIFFSSGTSGEPKGIMHTNQALVWTARMRSGFCGYQEGMSQLMALPLYHCSSFTNILVAGMMLGHTLHASCESNPVRICKILEKKKIEIFITTPSSFTLMLMSGMHRICKLEHCKIFGFIGSPKREVIVSVRRHFPHIKQFASYGLTEACSSVSMLHDNEIVDKSDSAGKPLPGVDIKMLDINTNSFAKDGHGEILVKKPYMMGYINADSSKKFYRGYLRTGDLGLLSRDNFLYIKGRIDDIVKVNGFNVSPSMVETALRKCPLIKEIAIVPKKTILDTQLIAFVEPANAEIKKIELFAKENLAKHMQPVDYILVDKIPLTPFGKVDRNALSRRLEKPCFLEGKRLKS